jgi:hypothetical protein
MIIKKDERQASGGPASYVKSCQEFFKELGNERQATGAKLQTTSCKKILRRVGTRVKNRFNRKI